MRSRNSKRIPVSIDADIAVGGATYKGIITNISPRGLYILEPSIDETLRRYSESIIDVNLYVPYKPVLKLKCRKKWLEDKSSGHTGKMGIEIIEPPQEYKEFFRATYFKVKKDISHEAIAVIGMACHYPGAPNPRMLWENVLSRRREFRRIPDKRLPQSDYYDPDPRTPDKTYVNRAAVIDGFEFNFVKRGIPKTVVESADIVHWIALEVALQALEDSGYTKNRIPADRTGVIIGNTLTGEHSRSNNLRLRWPYVRKTFIKSAHSAGLQPDIIKQVLRQMESEFKLPFPPITEDSLAGNLSNTIAGRICNYLDLRGGGYTVDGACSSSLIAVATAATHLSIGMLDLAVAGGIDISLDTFELIGFAKAQALTREDMRVYDKKASGFLPGEGAGFVILKRLEDAIADGDRVYATLRGWAISSDGKGGITAPKALTQSYAISRAYSKTDYDVNDIDFIEGHGTGTVLGDKVELTGISQAMKGRQASPLRSCGITSLKSLIGHTKAASGIGGFIKAVIAVNHRVIPPTAACTEPNDIFYDKAKHLYPVRQGEIRNPSDIIRAGVSGMGFGGINCHVTIESLDPPDVHLEPSIGERELLVSSQETELVVMSAENQSDLLNQVRHMRSTVEGISLGELVDFAKDLADNNARGSFRAAVIANSTENLIETIGHLEQMLHQKTFQKNEILSNTSRNIWVGHPLSAKKIGFLFPGQGSQQLNMGRRLVERFAWARDIVKNTKSWLKDGGFADITEYIYRPLDRVLGDELPKEWKASLDKAEIAQPAICLTSILWVEYLKELGITPAAVGGHSLGELTAFYASGVFDEKTLLLFAAMRGQVTAAPDADAGVMASLGCDEKQTEEILADIPGYVVIANINSPTQTVISGQKDSVDKALQVAESLKIKTKKLSVANAFHSKFMSKAAEYILREAPITQTLPDTKIKVLSSVRGSEIRQGINLLEHFSRQVITQTDFIGLIQSMAKECDIMVEVGPGRVLSDLVRSITGEHGTLCFPVEPNADNDRALNILLACFFANGGDIDWSALYANRLVRPFVPASARLFIDNPCERTFALEEDEVESPSPVDITPVVITSKDIVDTKGLFTQPQIDLIRAFIRTEVNRLSDRKMSSSEQSMNQNVRVEEKEDDSKFTAIKGSIEIHEAEPDSSDNETNDAESILSLLREMIEERTGFPRSSLSTGLKLLDDLNLDSIKAAELIAAVSSKFGISGKLDASRFANATLSEIAKNFASYINVQGSTNVKKETSVTQLNAPRWVRNFVVSYQEEPLADDIEKSGKEDGLRNSDVLIIVDTQSDTLAGTLKELLEKRKAKVRITSFDDSSKSNHSSSFDHIVAILPKKLSEGTEPAHELRMTAILKRLYMPAVIEMPKISLSYLQFGGGYFGTKFPQVQMEQCCAKSFAASVHHERPKIKVRVLDFSPDADDRSVAQSWVREINTEYAYVAAGYDASMIRRTPRTRIQNPGGRRNISWSAEDVVLVTGGAKGITAECAFAFAKKTGARMILIGSSSASDTSGTSEISRATDRFTSEGLFCRYFSCDVTDEGSLSILVGRIRDEMGEITGVIHGAGLNKPNRVEDVSLSDALREVKPKVAGTMNLINIFNGKSLKLFTAFTSIIGITGMPGNAWYAFSNEAVDVQLGNFREANPGTAVVCMAYSIWESVGMGSRMGSVQTLAKMGIDAIPTDEGVSRFLRSIFDETEDRQVIVAARLGALDTWPSEKHTVPATRFVEKMVSIEPGVEAVVRARLTLEEDVYLKDHVWKGTYLFPTVFGLEAMSQAVALVTGKTDFENDVIIENIKLDKPISVTPATSCEIELHAEVMERTSPHDPLRVNVDIRSEQTGFSVNHFSSVFILEHSLKPPLRAISLPEAPLDIEPSVALYGSLLFQGSLFQRVGKIYHMDSNSCIFSLTPDIEAKAFIQSSNTLLMGDPFCRDSLLQGPQLPLSQHICLPLEIGRIETYKIDEKPHLRHFVIATIESRTDQFVNASVDVIDEKGQIIEKLSGYKLKVMEYHKEFPTAEELAQPAQRDQKIIHSEIESASTSLGLKVPAISLSHIPGIHDLRKGNRRSKEIPVITDAAITALQGNTLHSDIDVSWTESGKPVISTKGKTELHASLSHDQFGTVICSAGEGPQGCDIAPVLDLTSDKSISLMGQSIEPLLSQLSKSESSDNLAGIRIWAAREALRKATGIVNSVLEIDHRNGDKVLFKSQYGINKFYILTFPIRLTRPPERMIAIVVEKASLSQTRPHIRNIDTDYFDLNSHTVNVTKGPQGQPRFVFQFPITFKEASNPSRTLYFSHFFNWIGKLREFVIQPVYKDLIKFFSTGQWGMVTNHAETIITGTAQSGDIVEGSVWFDDLSGSEHSKIKMRFEWRKKTENGDYSEVASSTMTTTWVAIKGHGQVEVRPLPDFAKEFLVHVLPPINSPHGEEEEALPAVDLGKEIYSEPAGPIQKSALLHDLVFDTSLEDANLVGNIYFSNYYLWQGRVRDHFVNKIAPEYYYDANKIGELRCFRSRVNYMQEAMPFEKILVRMHRSAVYEKGIKLYFDYYCKMQDGTLRKLGYGEHDAIWFEPSPGKDDWTPAPLPQKLLDAILPVGISPKHRSQLHERNIGKDKYDIIIIGSGVGGLSVAALLSQEKQKVLVIEQHNKPGGFCTSWKRTIPHNGHNVDFTFEAGVHDIAAFGEYSNIFNVIRCLNMDGRIDWRRVDHEYIADGKRLKVPRDFDAYRDLLCKEFPSEKEAVIDFFKAIRICFEELYNRNRVGGSKNIDKWRNVGIREVIDSYFHDKTIKKILLILASYITDDVSKVNALTAVPCFGYYIKGGYFPVGGSQKIPNILVESILGSGGELRLRTMVEKILVKNKKVTGVRLGSGQTINADIVISNADPKKTLLELLDGDNLETFYRERIAKLIPANSAFMVSLGLDFIPNISPATFIADDDLLLGVMVPSKVDISLVSPGYSCVNLIQLLQTQDTDEWNRTDPSYVTKKKAFGDKLIIRAEKAISDLKQHIIYRADASPATFTRYVLTSKGAIYGLQINEWRPSNTTPIEGLYLVGAGTSLRPGVEDAVYTGLKVFNTIKAAKRNSR